MFIFRGILPPGFVGQGDAVLIGSSGTAPFRYGFVLDSFEQAGKLNFELPRYPVILLFSLVGRLFTTDVANRLLVILSCTVGFYTMFLFSLRLVKSVPAAFLAGLFYGVNPWVISRILSGHIGLLLGYGLIPLFLIFYFASVDFPDGLLSGRPAKRVKHMLLSSVVLAGISSAVMLDGLLLSLAIVSILLFSWMLFALLSKDIPSKRYLISQLILRSFIVVSLSLLLSSYWLLPFAVYTLSSASQIGSSTVLPWLQSNLSFESVLRLNGYWWLQFSKSLYDFDSPVLNGLYFILSWLPLVLLLNTVPWMKSSKERLIKIGFYAIFCLGLVLNLGGGLLGSTYRYFMISGVFRDPDKYGALVAFAYAVFMGIFAAKAVQVTSAGRRSRKGGSFSSPTRRYLSHLSILLLTASILFVNWPVLTGDFRGSYDSLSMPKAYSEVNGWLAEQQGDFRVIWLPSDTYLQFNWSKGRSISEPVRYLSGKPTVQMVDPARDASPWTSLSILQLNHLLQQNETRRVGLTLGLMNVKYVIYRSDVVSPVFPDMLSSLETQHDLRLAKQTGPFYVFENKAYMPKIRVVNNTIVVVDGTRGLSKLSYLDDDFSSTSLLYLENIGRSHGNVSAQLNRAGAFFFSLYNFEDLFLATLPHRYFYDAYNSAVTLATLDKYTWVQSVFEKDARGSLLYGSGDARTLAGNAVLEIPIQTQQAGNYDVWVRLFGEPWLYTVSVNGAVLYPVEHPTNQGLKWVRYQAVNLSASNQMLRIISNNQSYLHVVDEVAIVPDGYSEAARSKILNLLAQKPFLIYEEAEEAVPYGSSKYITDPRFSEKSGLLLNGSSSFTVGATVVIPRDNVYQVAVLGASLNASTSPFIYLRGDIYNASSHVAIDGDLDWHFSTPVELKKGEYRVFINGTNAELDALAILRAGNETFWLKHGKPAQGVTFSSSSPTEIDVTDEHTYGSETDHSSLVFSGSFNSNWGAYVAGSSEKPYLCDAFSICVDLPPSGSGLDVKIEYGLQWHGYAGYAISLATLLSLVLTLLLPDGFFVRRLGVKMPPLFDRK
ncbi:MAG: hypothetical protein M1503_09840 [Thaumarchaeota archaeon]|nr:hypothetical protein [Nitrososphaerota archaeon]